MSAGITAGRGERGACRQPAKTHFIAASSRSASSSTITAHFPPSSISTGLRYFPASEPIIFPTAAEPMNSTFLMALWDIKASVTAGASSLSTWTTLIASFGRPASKRACTSRWWDFGESSLALRTTVQPAARGVHMALAARIRAAFQLEV